MVLGIVHFVYVHGERFKMSRNVKIKINDVKKDIDKEYGKNVKKNLSKIQRILDDKIEQIVLQRLLSGLPTVQGNDLAEIGVPDIIINNAGAGAFYEWSNFPLHEIHRQINLLYVSPILICRKFAPPMKKLNKGIIANISSLAILYPVPFMPIYNSTKSALSSFTQSMILEFIDYPKFMDFRLGDVFTNFNKNLSKQPKISTNNKLNSAWKQIDLQLVESPTAKRVSENILKNIIKNKSGVFYGGGFFQSKIAPLCSRFFSQNGLIFLLRRRYFK